MKWLKWGILGLDEINRRFFVKYGTGKRFRNLDHIEIGDIVLLNLRINGCSPVGRRGQYGITARHCVTENFCVLYRAKYSDGNDVNVVQMEPIKACSRWLCGLLARTGLNRFFIIDRCIEEYDIAYVDRYGIDREAVGVLFAGDTLGKLALITALEDIVDKNVRIVSYDYYNNREVEWRTRVGGKGVFLIQSDGFSMWFRAYYILYPPVRVLPGFSGSPVFVE